MSVLGKWEAQVSSLNLDETRDWLDILYGSTPGLINICSTGDWAGRNFEMTTQPTDTVLAYIQALDSQGAEGIYLRATTLRQAPERGSRGGDDLSFYLPGLWGDIDIAGPGHKTKNALPPTVEQAMNIVEAAGLPQPSHWIHSGGGLYPWWLLESPLEITDLENIRSLSAGWQQALARGAAKLGYHYGSGVGDLSRVLRIPGTVNRKAGMRRPCTMLEGHSWNGPLYDEASLYDALAAATPAPPAPVAPTPIQVKMGMGREGEKPGDEFNRTASWQDILLPYGWQWIRKQGDSWYLRRPGKMSGGHSATLKDSTDRLWVFSEEAQPFEAFKLYDKFGAYAALEHGGDFAAAARALGARGYGKQPSHVVAQPAVEATLDTHGLVAEQPSAPVPQLPDTVVPQQPATLVVRQRTALGLPMYTANDLVGMSWDGIGVARKWVELHEQTFTYIPADNQWMMWDGTRWIADTRLRHEHAAQTMVEAMLTRAKTVEQENPEIGKALVKEARKLTYATSISSIIRNSRSDPRIVADHEDFDKDPNLLTVGNGVLNLQTMRLSPHDPGMMLTRKVNADYQPLAPQGRWHRFMQEVLPDENVRAYVQRVCGYMLTGSMSERVMVLLYGESGTGKTQFLEAISAVMGDFAGVAPASAFQPRQQGYKGPSEDLHKLRGKRFVMQSELDSGSRFNEPLVKSIVGADTQSTRPLYGAPVDWKPEYTVFLATNHLPRISSTENAIWNRVKPVHFGQVFINEHGQALDPSERSLGRRMAAEEPEAILNWLLEGLEAYQRMGLAEPEQIGQWLNQYREDVDTCRQFLTQAPEDGVIVVEHDATITVTDLYRRYAEWCQHNGIPPLGLRNFNARMESAGFERKKRERGVTWAGIGVGQGQWLVSGATSRSGNWWQRE